MSRGRCGARDVAPQYKPLRRDSVKYIIVHLSGSEGEAGHTAQEIDREHRKRGLLSLGYHFVIRRDGKVEPGRSLDVPGVHTRSYNQLSLGVCIIGASTEHPTVQQHAAMANLIRELELNYPGAEVVGHRDLNPKVNCPPFDVKAWLAEKFPRSDI